jgi:hypothetical protein
MPGAYKRITGKTRCIIDKSICMHCNPCYAFTKLMDEHAKRVDKCQDKMLREVRRVFPGMRVVKQYSK